MKYRRFGKTGLDLSVVALCTKKKLASAETAYQTLQAAVSLGINHLETAQGYGHSEQYIGAALQNGLTVPRSQLYITTKLPPTPDAATMAQRIDQSLDRLQVDYLDALAVHGLNTWEHLAWVEAEQGCMQAIQQAMSDGRVRHVGFSTHGALDVILAVIKTDLFEFVNLHYSYFFQRNAPAIDLAYDNDMGVFIISPADKGGLLYTPPPTLEQQCQPFSPLELNYRFLLSDPRITTLSVGPANASELMPPLAVADRDGPLSPAEASAFARLEAYQVAVLGRDRCSQCYACLPCPEEIHIPEVLRLRNLAIAFDMTQFGQYRYRMFENAGHWFPGNKAIRCTDCGDCLPRCPETLDIPTLLRDTHQRLNGASRRRLWE